VEPGRHAILRGWWGIPVRVQIPPSAPYIDNPCVARSSRAGGANPAATLKDFLARHPGFTDVSLVLAEIYVQQGDRSQAEAVLRQAQQVESFSPRDRGRIAAALQNLSGPQPSEDNHPNKR
jgi:cytochrome c-type biogenesis protein CcmH/NrfG